MVRVLLTGFGPFPSVTDNPSGWLAETLAETLSAPSEPKGAGTCGFTLHSAVFPTEWDHVAAHAVRLYREVLPDLLIHFGVSPRIKIMRLERTAVNRIDRRPDACGNYPNATRVADGGHERLETRLPVSAVAARLRGHGHDALVSNACGRYLCNLLYYQSLAWAHANGSDALFVHVPLTRAQGGLCEEEALRHAGEATVRFMVEEVLAAGTTPHEAAAHPAAAEKQSGVSA